MQPTRDYTIRPGDTLWDEFIERLQGDDGCALTAERWTCFGDQRLAKAILEDMGFTEMAVIDVLRYCRKQDGYCDCEIVMNVPRRGFDRLIARN